MSKLLSLREEIEIYCPKIEILDDLFYDNQAILIKQNGVLGEGEIREENSNLYWYTSGEGKMTSYNSLKELIDALCSTLPNALEI
jgi:hypothetical protein